MIHTISTAIKTSTALLAALALTGCGAIVKSSAPAATQAIALHGRVMGGQQPVSGGTVQLWAAGSTGYGSASTALITIIPVTTSDGTGAVGTTGNNSNNFNLLSAGSFEITGLFDCPTPDTTPVYITITGGNPGGGTNANLALMAALGPCNNLVNIPFVNVNELTTVASVWALAPFMKSIDHIGTSSTNALGLANAFATVNNVVNIGSGGVGGPTLPSGATLPADEIYALGDILATCINSQGGTDNDGSRCGALFHLAKPGATAPTDAVTAAMNIAQNPSLNASSVYDLLPSTGAVFTTNLTRPSAWTIAINYTGGGLNSPKGVAVDANGNIWSPNAGNNSVSKFNNAGTAQSGTSGFTAGSIFQPSYIAINASGAAWVANADNAGTPSITQLSSDGSTGTQIVGNGLSTPSSIAFDSAGNIWVANNGNSSVSAFSSNGSPIGNYTGAGVTSPVAIAVNPQ